MRPPDCVARLCAMSLVVLLGTACQKRSPDGDSRAANEPVEIVTKTAVSMMLIRGGTFAMGSG